MARVLILEGNPPELLERRYRAGLGGTAEGYAEALIRHAPGLETTVVRPYFPDHAYDPQVFEGVDGVVCTGSGVSWSAADARAAPFWALYEVAFARGLPVLGSCWGLQVGAVVLGGAVAAGPEGTEVPVARGIRLTEAGAEHPLHAGRTPTFDALCVHRDEVSALPDGAVLTATNAHSRVQAMVVEAGSVRFWGVQYHPEMDATDMSLVLDRIAEETPESEGADLRADLANPGILDRAVHETELANWLAVALAEPA